MTEPNQWAVEPPTPIWVSEQPSQARPFDQQASFPTPPPFQAQPFDQQASSPQPPPFQYGFVPPVAIPVETKSPLTALVCGLVCWLIGGPILAVPAIIFGLRGRREAREGRTANGGMATAGLWLGVVHLVVSVLCVVFFLFVLVVLGGL